MPQLIGALLIIYVVCMIIYYIVIPGILIIAGIGALFGGAISLRNYVRAFRHNVKLERPAV